MAHTPQTDWAEATLKLKKQKHLGVHITDANSFSGAEKAQEDIV